MSEFYLTDLSEKDKPWDSHRRLADGVRDLYLGSELTSYGERIELCAKWLQFALVSKSDSERSLKLELAKFCRVRHCPVCQWRRALMWRGRFFNALPAISRDFSTARWLFLTLTVKNCELDALRGEIGLMNKAFKRLAQSKTFPALGYVRSLEVTRDKSGMAHPHFHVLMLVPSSYFAAGYTKQATWVEMWQKALRVDYAPSIDIRAVKPKKGADSITSVMDALKETLKYTVKESDLVSDRAWLIELTRQLHKLRATTVSGVLKNYLSESEPENEDLIHAEENSIGEISPDDVRLLFGWKEKLQRYKGSVRET
jgi:plasmid rolling circle replication initiator protein Rep